MNSLLDLVNDIGTNWRDVLLLDDFRVELAKIDEQLRKFIEREMTIYPERSLVFNAFRWFNVEDTRVVILGLDPYINEGQAMGMSFSVPAGVKVPPSLKNIFKELSSDLGEDTTGREGDLTTWVRQGVLLLNCYLTVQAGKTGSHKKLWKTFSDHLIREISGRTEGVVFMLWGNDAQERADLIDAEKHLILRAAHPSPLSASRGFFGCKHFSKCNEYLREKGVEEVKW